MPQFDLVDPAAQSELAIRVDITGVVGRTSVAAVIARALKDAFPDTLVQVQNPDMDFRYRAAELARDEPMRVQAERIVIVDCNARYRIPDDLPRNFVTDIVRTDPVV